MKSETDSTQKNKLNRMIADPDTPAALPAALLTAFTLVMLLMDAAVPGMKDRQYVLYPALMRIAGLIAIPCAGSCFVSRPGQGRKRADPAAICFMLFALCIVISTAANGISKAAVFGEAYRYIGVFDLFIFMGAYMYCSGLIRSGRLREALLLGYIAVSDLIAILFLIDFRLKIIEAFRGKLEPAGLFFHGNHYGYFLVMASVISACFFLLDRDRKRIAAGALSLALNLAALAVNRTMGALLAAGLVIAGLTAWLLIRSRGRDKRALVFAALAAASAAAALAFSSSLRGDLSELAGGIVSILSGNGDNTDAGTGRWGLWQVTLWYIEEKPLFGYGCEGISEFLYGIAETANPHNELLTYAAFFGIPAAVFYTAGALITIAKSLRSGSSGQAELTAALAAAGYFISSLFGVAMFYTAPFFFVMLGLSRADDAAGR